MTDIAELARQIDAKRQQLDTTFANAIRSLRRQHGDATIDQALSEAHRQQAKRDAIAASQKRPGESGPKRQYR